MKKEKILTRAIACAAAACLVFSGCSMQNGETPQEATNKAEENSTNVAETTLEASGVRMDIKDYSSDSVTWGPGNIKDHKRPTDPENLQNKYGELNAQWLLPEGKSICLTFDEGYENGYTAQILDTLAEKNIKAIFFCTYDYVKDNPTLVRRMINEGHIVGNHSYNHYNMTQIDLETASDEIDDARLCGADVSIRNEIFSISRGRFQRANNCTCRGFGLPQCVLELCLRGLGQG